MSIAHRKLEVASEVKEEDLLDLETENRSRTPFLRSICRNLLLNLLSHKGVQHRVHAAVQKAKAFSCEHGNVHRHLCETAELNHFGSQERVNYRGNMEGGPAQKKGHNHSYDDLHGSLFS